MSQRTEQRFSALYSNSMPNGEKNLLDVKKKNSRIGMIGEAVWDGGHLTDDSIHGNSM